MNLLLTLFDSIAYVIPGFTVISIILLHTTPKWGDSFTNYFLVFTVIAYVLGLIVHSLSFELDIVSYLWKLYHYSKESDKEGHGLKTTNTFKGKFANCVRWIIEKIFKKESILPLEVKLLKEQPDTRKYYDYLDYQKTLSRSMWLIFLIYSLYLLFFFFFFKLFKLEFYLPNDSFKFSVNTQIVFIASILVSLIWKGREKFFTSYKLNVFKLLDKTK